MVPDGVYEHFEDGIGARGADSHGEWTRLFAAYRAQYPELAAEIDQMQRRELPNGWDRNLPVFPADPKGVAGREASGKVLNVLAQNIPWFMGGSADLGPSNKTLLTYEGAGHFQANNPGGKNLHFGIREHAMGATLNGLAISKVRPYGATFFIFSDYERPAIRLAALMELPAIFVFTHDAMGDGEDGPTHQPVEHLASLRAHPWAGHSPARRCERSGRGLPLHHAASSSARRACALAAAAPHPGPDQICGGHRCIRAGPMCSRTRLEQTRRLSSSLRGARSASWWTPMRSWSPTGSVRE